MNPLLCVSCFQISYQTPMPGRSSSYRWQNLGSEKWRTFPKDILTLILVREIQHLAQSLSEISFLTITNRGIQSRTLSVSELKKKIPQQYLANGSLPDSPSICLGNLSIITIDCMTVLPKVSMLLFYVTRGRQYQTLSYFLGLCQEQKISYVETN